MLWYSLWCMLVGVHFLCDFPLQGDYLAKCKDHKRMGGGAPWWFALLAHAWIQAFGVMLVLHLYGFPPVICVLFGSAELLLHTVIDFAKNDGFLGHRGQVAFLVDQLNHILCKAVWVWSLMYVFRR